MYSSPSQPARKGGNVSKYRDYSCTIKQNETMERYIPVVSLTQELRREAIAFIVLIDFVHKAK